MASVRSEIFWARVAELGLEDCIPNMKAKGLNSYAKFAFGSDYTPQQADPSTLVKDLLKPLAGDKEELIPLLRLLWWESWGAATADMKKVAEGTEGDAPRRLSPPELSARRKQATDKLEGVTITQELEVSDALITECVGMVETRNKVKYVPWESCTTASMETVGVKKDSSLTADLATDLKVDSALKRRGLGLFMADAMDWHKHERIRAELMSAHQALPPPGYRPLTMAQLRRADEVAFVLLEKATRSGIKKVGNKRPLDEHVEAVLKHRDFNVALQPLPGSATAEKRPSDQGGEGSFSRKQRKAIARAKEQAAGSGTHQSQQHRTQQDWGQQQRQYQAKAAGKGGSKGKDGGAQFVRLPLALRVPGAAGVDKDGIPVCFGFNLNNCSAAAPGGRCPKGRHVCVVQSCGEPHSYAQGHK